jgi:hypothetical protein
MSEMRRDKTKLGNNKQTPDEFVIEIGWDRGQRLRHVEASQDPFDAGPYPEAGAIKRGRNRAALVSNWCALDFRAALAIVSD